MKRVNSEIIHATVLDYLKKRNFVDQTAESFSKKYIKLTESVEEFAMRTILQRETGAKNPVSCESCDGSPDESTNQFANLAEFVKDALPQYKGDIEKFIFPVFVHLFLEMIYNGHKAEAHSFYARHQEVISSLSTNKVLLQSLTEVMSTVDILNNPLLMTFRECKFKVEISHESLQYLLRYLQSQDTSLILKVLNFHIHIEVKNGSKDTAPVVRDKEPSENATSEATEPQEEEGDIQEMTGMEQNAAELKKVLEAVRDGAPAAPSILLYTFLNAYQGLSCARYSHDKNVLVGGYEDSALRIWNTKGQKWKSTSHQVDVSRIYLSGDVVNSDDSEEDKSLSEYQVLRGHSGPVYSCSIVPDSDVLLSCSEDTTIRGWNLSSQTNVAVYRGHNYPVWDIDMSPSNLFFASASKDSTARLWSTERTYPLRVYCGHLMDVDCVKFHPNCKYLATGSNDKSVRLWDINAAKSVRLFTGHRSTVLSLAFSPDGNFLASAGEDRRIKLWDLGSGSMVKEFRGHGDTVYSLCFSPDNSMLASGSIDNSIRIWDIRKNFSAKTSEGQSTGTSQELVKHFSTKSTHIHYLQFVKSNLVTAVGGTTHS
ncbi:hypothetical protein HOLleu_40535 [Holothuria leucospilota]|uniref:TFIID subunit TAF5 NTD2 domain-containing protein n=1 Tax=Holothuria leucospilota TaxID=206669 RepID=A0A9Q1BDN7_HOLLE|nr:hypothetical protein HOLleu_40535 [Holothuria leucospilota]